MLDPEWSLRGERAITWWPHELAMTIRADEPIEDSGVVGCRVHAETDVLVDDADAAAGPSGVDGTLASLMRFPPMASFLRDARARRVRLFSGVFVHEVLAPFQLARFSVAVLLQATYAALGSAALSRLTGLEPARGAHPVSGWRDTPDDLLNLAAERVVPAGAEASRWSDPAEMIEAAGALEEHGARARPSPLGIDARLPFRRSADPFDPAASALLQVRHGQAHPELGNGVFLRLFLPGRAGDDAAKGALELNALERRDPAFASACLGSWTIERAEPEQELFFGLEGVPRLAYVLFLPNYVYLRSTLRNLAVELGVRALWAAHVLSHPRPS